MNLVFVDSFYFFAILNPTDAAHLHAVGFSKQHAARLLTTTWILTEVADGLARSAHRSVLKRLVSSFRAVAANEIVETTDHVFNQGVDLYDTRADKKWSLTDCISFVVMRQRGIQDALTGDHHYEQAGFRALLK
jgi:predicted nucleic acid-binding protein